MAAKGNLDTAQRQEAREGLRELACLIAEAYRHRATDNGVEPLTASNGGEENTINESEIIASTEPADSHSGFVYTETVKVENLMRRKAPRLRAQESAEKPEDSQGDYPHRRAARSAAA